MTKPEFRPRGGGGGGQFKVYVGEDEPAEGVTFSTE